MKILKNKIYLVFIIIFIAVIIFALVGIFELIIPSSSKSLYGNRLDNIASYPIPEDKINSVKDIVLANSKVKGINYDIKGKILNFIITLNSGSDLVDAKGVASTLLKNFTDEQKSYYDFQVFIKMDEESEIFPIIGYKHVSSLDFVWTNN